MYVTLPLYHATGVVVCWCGVIAGSATLAIRRKYSTSAFWKDVQNLMRLPLVMLVNFAAT